MHGWLTPTTVFLVFVMSMESQDGILGNPLRQGFSFDCVMDIPKTFPVAGRWYCVVVTCVGTFSMAGRSTQFPVLSAVAEMRRP